VVSKAELFAQSDVLSIHLRLHNETRGAVTLADLLSMKPTALFVNTSRAELVEENALVTALNRGRPGMAAIDVFESEPILQGHSLLRMENAICTPHLGYVERENYELYFRSAFQNILDYLAGGSHNTGNAACP
jgi:D-3-phosphoglycerate dehydrogenase